MLFCILGHHGHKIYPQQIPERATFRGYGVPPIEFDEKLGHTVVDRVTVYNDDRLVYSLKDGTEITVML